MTAAKLTPYILSSLLLGCLTAPAFQLRRLNPQDSSVTLTAQNQRAQNLRARSYRRIH